MGTIQGRMADQEERAHASALLLEALAVLDRNGCTMPAIYAQLALDLIVSKWPGLDDG